MSLSLEELSARDVLEAALGAQFGRPVAIVAYEQTPHEARSIYPLDRLRVTLDSGERLRIVFKRIDPELEPEGNRQEVLVYERLLSRVDFGAPTLYASVYDERTPRYWLFLEDLDGWSLEACDKDEWLAATVWLARMHAKSAARLDEFRALGCLGEHDAAYYRGVEAAARSNLALAGIDLDGGLACLDSLVGYLLRSPRTMLHADLTPLNVIVQPGPRFRPIDWENAAIGPLMWDLARLVNGWGDDIPQFRDVYIDELQRASPATFDRGELERCFACCEIVGLLWLFSKDVEWCIPYYWDWFCERAESIGREVAKGAFDA